MWQIVYFPHRYELKCDFGNEKYSSIWLLLITVSVVINVFFDNLGSGDFMDEHKLPSADLYLLSQIIHDWRPDQVDFLLDKVFKAVLPGRYRTHAV